MRPALFICLLVTLVTARGQDHAPDEPVSDRPLQKSADRTGQPVAQQQKQSVLKVKPGTEALKDKDLYVDSGYFHPFRRMTRFVLVDQKKIWTSPFHTSKEDIKWWVIFGGVTAGLIAADKNIQQAAPNNSTLVHIGTDASYLGTPYTLIPISAGFYFIGTAAGSDHFRETGLLSFETLIDVTVVQLVIKSVTNRERPLQGSGEGHFFSGASPRYSSSFPSGHAIDTFALASIFAHEYPHKWWVQAIVYGYAGGVMAARLAANKHFPGDVAAGGAMGWFIGDYVYGKRHNPDLDAKRSLTQKILAHVRIGGHM
jgi:membrane-associated phospholipid phosphatase